MSDAKLTYAEWNERDCRLRMLMILAEQTTQAASSELLRYSLEAWHHDVEPIYLRRQADHLARVGAVKITETVDEAVFVAKLLQPGMDHLKGRSLLPQVLANAVR